MIRYIQEESARDSEEFYDNIDLHDVPGRSDHVLDQTEQAFSNLSDNPERRVCPIGLSTVGLREYRESISKPCSIICRGTSEDVYVMVIADGRRENFLDTVDISGWGAIALLRDVLWLSLSYCYSISCQFSALSRSHPIREKVMLTIIS